MKKRLRKKLHLREFSEYGIDFKLQVKPPITDKDFDTLIELFIEDFFERNGFYCGGGWNLKEKICSMFIETGRDIYTALNYSPKLSKWFEEKKINFQLTSTVCDNWYPERKINLSTPA